MEYNRLSARKLILRIGELNIAFSSKDNSLRMELPPAAMAFYQPREIDYDLEFIVDEQMAPKAEGKRLFGSDQYSNPTFLYQREDGTYDWKTYNKDNSPRLAYHISSDWKTYTLYEDNTDSKGERAFHEFFPLLAYGLLLREGCVLHGVVMEYLGKGILVLASSGTGKTTHTRLWRDYKNALILNGDRCLCRIRDGRWYAYGMPWAGSSGEYINRRVPVHCIVALERGERNEVQEMSLYEKILYLMQRIFAPTWPGELQNKAWDDCDALASAIPILRLRCLPDTESVDVLEEAMQFHGI